MVAAVEEQFDMTVPSILTTFEFKTVETGFMAGTDVSFEVTDAESVPWPLFSTCSCIFSSSTNFCSCSSFFINSTICRSFSWSLLSFSGTGKDPAEPELTSCGSDGASDMPTSCWRVKGSVGMGETGGVELTLSGAPWWAGKTMVGPVVVVISMGMEDRVVVVVVLAGGGKVVGAEVLGVSWKGFSLSIRSVFVPDTGRPRSFSSSFSSAT